MVNNKDTDAVDAVSEYHLCEDCGRACPCGRNAMECKLCVSCKRGGVRKKMKITITKKGRFLKRIFCFLIGGHFFVGDEQSRRCLECEMEYSIGEMQ